MGSPITEWVGVTGDVHFDTGVQKEVPERQVFAIDPNCVKNLSDASSS